jgi:bifunctional DNA-binding transcriptional regulator/antitoxin component of YhaV-PrlF toxin-antitoxin module
MSRMKISVDKKGRTGLKIPAFLRDKFQLKNGDCVDVDTDGTRIIVTILKDN